VAIALVLSAPGAMAQPAGPPGALRAQVRAQVRVAIERELARTLQLDAAAQARLNGVIDRYDAQIAAAQGDNAAAYRELQQLVASGRADDAALNRLADRMLGNRERAQKLELERDREVRRALAPQQYGRLLLAWPTVNRKVKREIFRAIAGQEGDENE
jgi:Spy/CpxP family protein refolding chaperone